MIQLITENDQYICILAPPRQPFKKPKASLRLFLMFFARTRYLAGLTSFCDDSLGFFSLNGIVYLLHLHQRNTLSATHLYFGCEIVETSEGREQKIFSTKEGRNSLSFLLLENFPCSLPSFTLTSPQTSSRLYWVEKTG